MNRDLVHTETVGPVTYRLYISPEDTPVQGNALASGDDALDKEMEDEILKRLDSDDTWAWAFVTVEACIGEFAEADSLGCCCYRDTADFLDDGYYSAMKAEALKELTATLAHACKLHELLAGFQEASV
jgi:hypothetical protein